VTRGTVHLVAAQCRAQSQCHISSWFHYYVNC